MSFWDRLVALCEAEGTTPTTVTNSLGIASGSVTRWKNGGLPRDTTLIKIARYFDVSPAYLKGESHIAESADLAPDEIKLLSLFAKLSEVERLRLLLDLQEKAGG